MSSTIRPPNGGREAAELVDLLRRLGVQQHAANVLVALSMQRPSDSRNLQQSCGLRQPEVSVAVAELRMMDVILMERQQLGGRGRPKHIYSLKGTLGEVLQPIKAMAVKRMDELRDQMARLNELTGHLRLA